MSKDISNTILLIAHLNAPLTQIVPTLSSIGASAKISSLPDGIVISLYGTALNEHGVTSTLVLAGSVTDDPAEGTCPPAEHAISKSVAS